MVDVAATGRRGAIAANAALALMVLLWGSSFPVVEELLKTWDVLSATVGRQLVAAAMLIALIAVKERRFPLRASLPWGRLIVLGAVGLGLSSTLMTMAVFYGGGLSTAMMSAASPIVAALTARAVFGMALYRGIVVGTLLAVTGGLVVIIGGRGGTAEFHGGELLVLLATVTWTWYSQAAQRWLSGYSQLHISGLTVGTGSVALLAVAALAGATGVVEIRNAPSPHALALVVYLGVAPLGIGVWLWHAGVSRVGVTIASIYGNFVPLSAVLVALVAFGALPTAYHLVGGAIIVAGVVYAQRKTRAGRAAR